MQFIESSVIGLRVARHKLGSRSFKPTVTLFPMIHVGEAAFFERVYNDAARHDIILLEGVRSKNV